MVQSVNTLTSNHIKCRGKQFDSKVYQLFAVSFCKNRNIQDIYHQYKSDTDLKFLQTLIEMEVGNVKQVHCVAHNLNLTLNDAVKEVCEVVNLLIFSTVVSYFIHVSSGCGQCFKTPVRTYYLLKHSQVLCKHIHFKVFLPKNSQSKAQNILKTLILKLQCYWIYWIQCENKNGGDKPKPNEF